MTMDAVLATIADGGREIRKKTDYCKLLYYFVIIIKTAQQRPHPTLVCFALALELAYPLNPHCWRGISYITF